jgi:hypothetical protein
MRALAVVALVALLVPGCGTLAGGITGGALAAHSNSAAEQRRARGEDVTDDETSVGGSVLLGAGLGFLADMALMTYLIHEWQGAGAQSYGGGYEGYQD